MIENDAAPLSQLALLLIFVPIVADTFLTLMRRRWAGHDLFIPHCDFYYQRMILAGIPKIRVALLYWLAMVLYGYWGLLIS